MCIYFFNVYCHDFPVYICVCMFGCMKVYMYPWRNIGMEAKDNLGCHSSGTMLSRLVSEQGSLADLEFSK